MDPQNPDTWVPPAEFYHPDFDAEVEIDMLREFARRLMDRWHYVGVSLRFADPAYLTMEIHAGDRHVADVMTVLKPPGFNTYYFGLFEGRDCEDVDEVYFDSLDEGVSVVDRILKLDRLRM